MPSVQHELVVGLLRDDPRLLCELLSTALGTDMTHGMELVTVQPIVIGPAEVPMITRRDDAIAWPELAMLSAIVHGRRNDAEEAAAVGVAALAAVARLDDTRNTSYADIVLAALGAAARQILEAGSAGQPRLHASPTCSSRAPASAEPGNVWLRRCTATRVHAYRLRRSPRQRERGLRTRLPRVR